MNAKRSVGASPTQAVAGRSARRTAVTRADVARMAGVSTAVVSYVVNNGPRPVAPATARRVRETMDLLGYRPNAAARALRRGTSETLGLVLEDGRNPHFIQYTFELVREAAARGQRLLIANSQHDEAAEVAVIEEFVARGVDGLLLASAYARLEQSRALRESGVPTVLIDCPGPIPGRRTVGVAADSGAERLVEHLVGHGRRRIGLVVGDKGFGDPDPRERGWRRALNAAGLPDGPIVRVPFTREGGYAATTALLAADPDLDGVFASNDLQAIGLVRALHERGVRMPDDIAVTCFDGTVESEYCWPPLTVARQPLPAMAAAAIGLVHAADTPTGTHVELEPDLVLRRSCGCPAPAETSQPRVDVLTR